MKKILTLSLLGILSHSAYASEPLVGDQYWGSTIRQEMTDVKKFNIKNISASSIEKTIKDTNENKISPIRLEMLQTAALSFGVQAGLANGAEVVNKALDGFNGKEKKLDKTYNFTKIQLEPGFLPPVISEGRNAYNQPSANEVRAADYIYKIEFPAKIVSAAPDWRSYLYVEVQEPEMPAKSSLPKTSAESKIWDEWIKKGWEQGYEQAGDLFESGLARLNRDFLGMIRFKTLYVQGKVTKPKITKTELGVTGGGKEMAVGDRVIKKTQDAELNPNTKKWFK